jgi:hypothetical protein
MTDAIAVRAQTRLCPQKSANCHFHNVNSISEYFLTPQMVFTSETEQALELAARSMPKNETMPEIDLIGA